VPIHFDDQSIDVSGVDDRRGGTSGGIAIAGGAGLVAVIVLLLNLVLGQGGGASAALPPVDTAPRAGASAESREQLHQRCSESGALDRYTDCRLIKIYTIADQVWRDEFARRGIEYSSPRLAFFTDQTQTGCGPASAEVGPFYCPADREIYFELGFLDVLQQKFGAGGDYAQAYIAAHEFGHHLQTLLGIEPQVRQIQQREPALANEFSVAMELQADCFAGVWATLSDRAASGIDLTQDNITEALDAAAAVGDDRIQAKVQGRVDPEGFTHGTAAQRRQWFATGYQRGTIDACNTFQALGLAQ
jgi:predicted metalloprotease